VVATVVRFRQAALAVDRPADFSRPYDQGVVERAALLSVYDEGGAGLVRGAAEIRHIRHSVGMDIPAALDDLCETHPALGHASGQEATGGEGPRDFPSGPYTTQVLAGSPCSDRSIPAHPKRRFIPADSRQRLGISEFAGHGLVDR
jgi:hypothetical protein